MGSPWYGRGEEDRQDILQQIGQGSEALAAHGVLTTATATTAVTIEAPQTGVLRTYEQTLEVLQERPSTQSRLKYESSRLPHTRRASGFV